ncbi:MAG: LysR family transcriptional regulator [Eubacterium sp.]|nr:LysR family transcriptional regulator [Eubacterium sp.]
MNDQQIDFFLSVARNGSFTLTAEEFYTTQPTVSK